MNQFTRNTWLRERQHWRFDWWKINRLGDCVAMEDSNQHHYQDAFQFNVELLWRDERIPKTSGMTWFATDEFLFLLCRMSRNRSIINNVLNVFRPKRWVLTMVADKAGLNTITENPFNVEKVRQSIVLSGPEKWC